MGKKPTQKQSCDSPTSKGQKSLEESMIQLRFPTSIVSKRIISKPIKGRTKKVLKKQDFLGEEEFTNPSLQIQQKFICYFNSIGLKNGLIFTEDQKEKLFQPHQIPQKETHVNQNQLVKAEKSLKNYCKQEDLNFIELSVREICEFFVQIGSLVNAEFSQQIYDFIARIIQSLKGRCQRETDVEDIYQSMKYINRKQITGSIKYCVQKIDEEQIRRQFSTLFLQLNQILLHLLSFTENIRRYLRKNREEANMLQEIMLSCNK